MSEQAPTCGDCLSFDPRMGLPWQYCPLKKEEVSAACKGCRFFHKRNKE